MGYHLLNVLTLVFLITFGSHAIWAARRPAIISNAERSTIENGLLAGTALATVLKDGNFRESLKKLGTNLAPFLSVLGPLIGVALAFAPTADSPELVYMRTKFAEVNNKLDIVISEFQEVKNAIDWSTIIVSYGTYERKIRAAQLNLNRIYEVEGTTRDNHKENFIIQYDNDFSNAVQKIYDIIVNDDHVISRNVLDAAVQQTHNHKRKIEQFSLGLVQLLMKGIMVKVSYYALKEWDTDNVVTDWQTKMNTLKTTLQTLSDTVKGSYLEQMTTDVQDLILRNHGLGNLGLLDTINDFVTDKFDWRFWFVAVYNDVNNDDGHAFFLCNGGTFLHQHEKNIVVGSQETTDERYSPDDGARVLKNAAKTAFRARVCPVRNRALFLLRAMIEMGATGGVCGSHQPAMLLAVQDGYDLVYRGVDAFHSAYRYLRRSVRCPDQGGGSFVPFNPRYTHWNFKIILFI